MHRINITFFFIILVTFCIADTPTFSASRPGNCNPSSVMSHGFGQIELGFRSAEETSSNYLMYRNGIIKNIEFFMVLNNFHKANSMTLATSYQISSLLKFLPESSIIFSSGISIEEGISFDNKSSTIYLPFSFPLYDAMGIGSQVGKSLYNSSFLADIYFWFGFGRSTFFIETYGNNNNVEQNFECSFDGGISYMLMPNLQIDLTAGFPGSENSEPQFIEFGIAYMPTK